MSDGWKTKSLEELCDFRNGLWKGKKPPYVEVGIIRNTNFTREGFLDDSDIAFHNVEIKQFEKRKLEFGDIILEKSGGGPKQPVGRVIPFEKTKGEFSFSNFTSVIRIKNKDELNYQFLHRLLFHFYVSGVTEPMQRRSTGIRNLDFKTYKQLRIPLPKVTEQKRIVAILDEAFSAIAKAAKFLRWVAK
ncbi:MAG: restriction endonuclease subunit S [Pirellulales bacterium]